MEPWAALSLLVFLVAAYLSLAQLDYVALWDDEGPTAALGRNLLENGDIKGWDGRNIISGPNGRTLNPDLRDVLPPLQYAVTAVGIALFGENEVGARVMHALAGVLALVFFYLALRQQLPNHPRLIFFIFCFAAWSAQLLLYFRQCRYYAVMALCMTAGLWLYERWWQTRKVAWLAALSLVALLAFLNHYNGGAFTMIALALWHLIWRARETRRRDWAALMISGLTVVALSLGYLIFIGLIGAERELSARFLTVDMSEYTGAVPLVLLNVWICVRDLFAADWISWPVFLWFIGMLWLPWRAPHRRPLTDALPVAPVAQFVFIGASFALLLAAFTQQPLWVDGVYLDYRYYVAALPLLLAMKGLFIEWLWRRQKAVAALVGASLLFTSVGAAPFNVPFLTGGTTLDAHLYRFVREIHRPYPGAIEAVSDYLHRHARQDDLVYLPSSGHREALTFYQSDRILFCGVFDADAWVPAEAYTALRPSLADTDCMPEWIILFSPPSQEYWQQVGSRYALAARLPFSAASTQRPEIKWHAFTPIPPGPGIAILRKRETPETQPSG